MLKSALSRASQKLAYDAHATLFELAAAYSFGIAENLLTSSEAILIVSKLCFHVFAVLHRAFFY